jgi:peptidoglycan glycosyltransferase
MVSSPSYDPLHKPAGMDENPAYEAVYLNRLLHGLFTPGSVFKIITAYCALEHLPDIDSRSFTCTGKYHTGDGEVTCLSKHGQLSFGTALTKSCNSVFAQLSLELGEDKLRAAAQKLGFGQALRSEKLPLAMSVFPARQLSPLALGWTGIGQGETLANPAQMMLLAGAIANGGKGLAPRLVLHTTTPGGLKLPREAAKTALTLDPLICARLRTLLRANVEHNYDVGGGKTGALQLCGKTGTAQVDGKQAHAWFVGACLNPQTPYAIVVVGENAGEGRAVAFEIAARVLRAMAQEKF